VPEGTDERYRLERYAREMVEADKNLAKTTRALQLRTIRVHIADTALANADVRTLTPGELDTWWSGLDAGNGALAQIHEVLSKVFRRAVRQELRTDNPLERSDVKKPRRRVRDEERPLTTAEVERLAASTVNSRDRVGPGHGVRRTSGRGGRGAARGGHRRRWSAAPAPSGAPDRG
jgi:hypothetical protein